MKRFKTPSSQNNGTKVIKMQDEKYIRLVFLSILLKSRLLVILYRHVFALFIQ